MSSLFSANLATRQNRYLRTRPHFPGPKAVFLSLHPLNPSTNFSYLKRLLRHGLSKSRRKDHKSELQPNP